MVQKARTQSKLFPQGRREGQVTSLQQVTDSPIPEPAPESWSSRLGERVQVAGPIERSRAAGQVFPDPERQAFIERCDALPDIYNCGRNIHLRPFPIHAKNLLMRLYQV